MQPLSQQFFRLLKLYQLPTTWLGAQQRAEAVTVSLLTLDKNMASISDCEDFPNLFCMEDDSLLDEFLFDNTNSGSPENARLILRKKEARETESKTSAFVSRHSDKKRQRCNKEPKTQNESPVKHCSKARLESQRERSVNATERNSGKNRDTAAVNETSSSMGAMAAMPITKLDSSWWKRWNFHELGRQKLRSPDSRRRIEHRKFRHEVHKKLTRIELQSLMLNTHSHYDLQGGSELWTVPQSRQLQRSASVTACCPGISRKHNCKTALLERLQKKFSVICQSSEERARCTLKKDLAENAYLLRWFDYMKVPKVKKRGLQLLKELKALRNKRYFPRGTPGFLQGKLWHIINAKNIDFSHAVSVLNATHEEPARDKVVRQRLMRHVIQYMEVLQNYPELSWLSKSFKKSETNVETKKLRPFMSHRTVAGNRPKSEWFQIKVQRGQLRCSDRYFLKRCHHTFQECLKDSSYETINKRDYSRGFFHKVTGTGRKRNTLAPTSKVKNVPVHSKRDSTTKTRKSSTHYPKVRKDSRGELSSNQSCCGKRNYETDTRWTTACLPAREDNFIPVSCRNKSPTSDSPCISSSSSRDSVLSDSNECSSNGKTRVENNKLASKGIQLLCRDSKFLRKESRCVASLMRYKKPKRLDIPTECSSKQRSLYDHVPSDILYLCCRNDPRLTAWKQAMNQKLEESEPITAFIDSSGATDGQEENHHIDVIPYSDSEGSFRVAEIVAVPEGNIIVNQVCSDNNSLIREESEPTGSENSIFSSIEKWYTENFPIDSIKKDTLLPTESDYRPCSGALARELRWFHQDTLQSNYSPSLISDTTKLSLRANCINDKTLPRNSGPLRMSHPSIRARLTKQDTVELLDELCAVVRPLSPLFEDDNRPHALDKTVSASKTPVGAIPVSSHSSAHFISSNGSRPSHALFGVVTMCGAVQEIKNVDSCTVPMQCKQASQYELCGVTLVQLFGPPQNMEVRITTENTQQDLRVFEGSTSYKKPVPNGQCCNEEYLTNLDDKWSLNGRTNNAIHSKTGTESVHTLFYNTSDNTPIANDIPREGVLSSPLGEKLLQEPLLNEGDFYIGAYETVNDIQTRQKYSPSNCQLHRPYATAGKSLSSLKPDSVGHVFCNKDADVSATNMLNKPNHSTKVCTSNKHNYTKPFNISEPIPVCHFHGCDGMYNPDCSSTNIKDSKELTEICEMPLDFSNNQGGGSAEGAQTASSSTFRYPGGTPHLCPEGPPATANCERDYLCDDMSTPIVLSAADRVYHVSSTSNTQTTGLSFCELSSARSVWQRDTNFDSTVVDTNSGSFLSEIYSSNDCSNLPEEPLSSFQYHGGGTCQNNDLLSKAMETAGLTDSELETFLTSNSTLEALFTDQDELNLNDFLSPSKPGCSDQVMEEQAKRSQRVGLIPDFLNENLDNQSHTRSILRSDGYCAESIRSDKNNEISTQHIRLDMCPATYVHTEAPAFKLRGPLQDDQTEFRENSSNEILTQIERLDFLNRRETCVDPDIQQRAAQWEKHPCNFLDVSELNQRANLLDININEKQGDGTHLDHLKDINLLNIQPRSANTKKGENSPMTQGDVVNENSFVESKNGHDKFLFSIFAEEVCYSVDAVEENDSHQMNMSGSDLVGNQSPRYIFNDSQNEPEILDLQPLSENLFEKRVEEEEEEEIREVGYICMNQNKTQYQINDDPKKETRGSSSQSTNRHPPLWCLRRCELIRTCMEREAIPYIRRSLPSRACSSPPKTPEPYLCAQTEISNVNPLFKARSIIRLEKNHASKICKSEGEICLEKLKRERAPTDHAQNKRRRKSDTSLIKKKAAQKKGKHETHTIIPENRSAKTKSGSTSTTAPIRNFVGGSSLRKTKRTVRSRTPESRPKGEEVKIGAPCSAHQRTPVNRRRMQNQDEHHQMSEEVCEVGLSEGHLKNETLTAEIFSKQLRSLSPGFLKNISKRQEDFLRPAARVNRISTKFPRPLATSKKMLSRSAIAPQRNWNAQAGCHNRNNNSMERTKPKAYENNMSRQKYIVLDGLRATHHLERRNSFDTISNCSICPNYREDRNYKRVAFKTNGNCIINERWVLMATSKDVTGAPTFEGRKNKKAKYGHRNVRKIQNPTLKQMINVEVDTSIKGKERKFSNDHNNNNNSTTTTTITTSITKKSNDRTHTTKLINSSSFVFYYVTACNTNNNSNQQNSKAQNTDKKIKNQEAEQNVDEARKGRNTKLSNRLETTPQSARLPRPALQVREELWHHRKEIKHELPRIGKNMENFHAASRKLKETNARLTKIHGKQNFPVAPTTAAIFAKTLASSNGVGRRKGEPHVGALSFPQTHHKIDYGQKKERLLAHIFSDNIPSIKDSGEMKCPMQNLEVPSKAKGAPSPFKKLSARQKGTNIAPASSKLQNEFTNNSNDQKETSKGNVLSKGITELGTTNASQREAAEGSRLSSNSGRDTDVGLARFIERLNSEYGQQLTRGNPQDQARLDQLCSRYMETLNVRRRIEEKVMGNARSTFNRSDVRAALGASTILNPEAGLQKRKRKGSSSGELQQSTDIHANHEHTHINSAKVTSRERDTNENTKISGDSGSIEKEIMKIGNKILSKNTLFRTKDGKARLSDKNESVSIASGTGKSPLSCPSQASQRKTSPGVLNSLSSKRNPRVKSASQLRPDLRESVERLSSRAQSHIARLQYDMSTWEDNFGKSFNVGLFDNSTASSGRPVIRPASSAGSLVYSSRPTSLKTGPGSTVSLPRYQKVELMKPVEEKSLANSSATASNYSPGARKPAPPRYQKSGEDKINTFFGSLLNLINEKEKQNAKKAEGYDVSESQAKIYRRKTPKMERQNEQNRDGRQDREKKARREGRRDEIAGRVGRECTEGSSGIGVRYRNMLETIKAKRSSFVVDSEDPWAITPLPSFIEMPQSPESMLNIPDHFSMSEAKYLGDSVVGIKEGQSSLGDNIPGTISGGMKDCPDTQLITSHDQPSPYSEEKGLILSNDSRSGPDTLQKSYSIDNLGLPPIGFKLSKAENFNLKPHLTKMTKNDNVTNTEMPPRSLTEPINGSSNEMSIETVLFGKSEEDVKVTSPIPAGSGVLSPKSGPEYVGKVKAPAAPSMVSASDSISCSRDGGGGDSGDEKYLPIQTHTKAAENNSFAVGFTVPAEMLHKEKKTEKKTSNESFHTEKVSPRFDSPNLIQSNASISENTSSALFEVSNDESLTWTGSDDLKDYTLQAPLFRHRSLHYREGNKDRTDLVTCESPSYQFNNHDNSKTDFWDSRVKNSFKRLDRDNAGIGDYISEDADFNTKHKLRFQDDERYVNRESGTSYARHSVPKYDGGFRDVDGGSISYNSKFSSQNNRDFNSFGIKTIDSGSAKSQYEITSLDALERQAEQDFGAIYRRSHSEDRRHRSSGQADWSPWQQDSRDKQVEPASFGTTSKQQGQATSSYYPGHSSMGTSTGLNLGYNTSVTDTVRNTYSHPVNDYRVGFPRPNHSYTTERSYSKNPHTFAGTVNSTVNVSSQLPSWSDTMPASRGGQSRGRHCGDIPWDQLTAPQVTSLGQRPLTAFDIVRQSLGHSYLAPIQEETEEDQR